MGVAYIVQATPPFKMAVKIEPKCSFGVASARHVSGLVVKDEDSPYLFDAPLGPSVVRWDLRNGERLQQFQVSSYISH